MHSARRLVAHTLGTGNDIVSPAHPPFPPPLLAVAPFAFFLPSYMPFDSVTWRWCEPSLGPVTWRRWGALTGCRAGVEASGRGDVALFAAFLTAVEAGDVAGSVVGGVWGR